MWESVFSECIVQWAQSSILEGRKDGIEDIWTI